MKKLLTLLLLLISFNSFSQKAALELNLKKDSTYTLTTNVSLTIIQDINGQKQTIATILSGTIVHKVIAIKDSVYQMEVRYTKMNIHMDIAGRIIDMNSTDDPEKNAFAKIMVAMINKPFNMD